MCMCKALQKCVYWLELVSQARDMDHGPLVVNKPALLGGQLFIRFCNLFIDKRMIKWNQVRTVKWYIFNLNYI